MKTILNITEHKDGTYSLNHLTHEQMAAIQSALVQNSVSLRELKEKKQADGHKLNPLAEFFLDFANEASDQIVDLGF